MNVPRQLGGVPTYDVVADKPAGCIEGPVDCSGLPPQVLMVITGITGGGGCESYNTSEIYEPVPPADFSLFCPDYTPGYIHCGYDDPVQSLPQSGIMQLLFQINPDKVFLRWNFDFVSIHWMQLGLNFPITITPADIQPDNPPDCPYYTGTCTIETATITLDLP